MLVSVQTLKCRLNQGVMTRSYTLKAVNVPNIIAAAVLNIVMMIAAVIVIDLKQ